MHFQYLGLGATAADMSRGGVIRPPGALAWCSLTIILNLFLIGLGKLLPKIFQKLLQVFLKFILNLMFPNEKAICIFLLFVQNKWSF